MDAVGGDFAALGGLEIGFAMRGCRGGVQGTEGVTVSLPVRGESGTELVASC